MRISEKSPQDARAAARPGLSGPASRKLPVPPRERKPALAALAVLLILGGALATTLLVMRSGDRVSAVQITQQVGAGQRIPPSALREVQIADTGIDYVAWRYRDQVITTYAAVTLLPGTLLTEPMTAKSTDQVGPAKAKVGLSLKAGQMPTDLRWSEIVQVVYVPTAGRNSATTQQKVLTTAARVESISSGRSGGGLVTIVVDTTIAPTIAQYASSGEIALISLPGVK
ncbi:hypothetical protein AB0C10_01365 [Microbispora amethystogenes]|uniref:hypothetical protein n=1 Tax=Microbispora amethystogenes TaxID=1427754 RepID=UPI0033D0107E